MAPVLKTGVPERVPGVRIPPSPPDFDSKGLRAQKEKSYKRNRIAAMSIELDTRSTNWWGRASTIGLFVWFIYWFKNEPTTPIGQVLLWGSWL
jgi:hypothetical protein